MNHTRQIVSLIVTDKKRINISKMIIEGCQQLDKPKIILTSKLIAEIIQTENEGVSCGISAIYDLSWYQCDRNIIIISNIGALTPKDYRFLVNQATDITTSLMLH